MENIFCNVLADDQAAKQVRNVAMFVNRNRGRKPQYDAVAAPTQ